MTDYTLRLVVDGDASGATSALNSATSALNSFGGNAMKAGGILSAGLTLPLVAIGKAAIDAGTKLNAGMANIGSMGIAIGRVNELKKSIQEVSIQTGKTTDDLAKGTYQIISAYGDSASTAKILEVNTKVAAAGVASLSDTVGAISIVTKNWGDTSVEAQQHVGDLLLKTVALGQTTLPELASNLGNVAPAAHAAGISTQEMFASIATAAGVTGNTSAAITQMNGVIAAFSKPSEDMSKLLKAQGFASGEAAIKALGFEGAMQMVYNAHVKTGTALASYTKRIEGARLIQALATTSAKTYGENLKALGNSAGTTDMAFDAQTNGANKAGFAMEVAKAKMEVFLQRINDGMGPAVLAFSDLVGPLIDKLLGLADTFATLSPNTQEWIVGIAAGAAAIGPLLLGVGALARSVAFFLPFAAGLATALIPVTIGLGLLYGAYKLNAFGLRDLVDTGFKRIQAAAPLAGDAVKSLWKQFTGSREDIGKTTLAIYDFVATLTGSDAAGLAAVNWVTGLATKIQDAREAFVTAGSGLNGFIAATGKLTGADVTINVKSQVTSVDWTGKLGALSYTYDAKAGITAIDWHGDTLGTGTFTYDAKAGIASIDWKNLLGSGTDVGFVYDATAGITEVHWNEDVFKYNYSATAGITTVDFGGGLFVGTYTATAGITKVAWGAYTYSYNVAGNVTSVLWGAYTNTYSTTSTITSVAWGAYTHEYGATGNVTSIAWGAYTHSYDVLGSVTSILWGTYTHSYGIAGDVTSILWGAYTHAYDTTGSVTSIAWGLFTYTYDAKANVTSWTILGQSPSAWVATLSGALDFSKATLPTWAWPDLPAFSWPSFPAFAWPAMPTFSWPAIPTPSWLASMLSWRPSLPFGIGGNASGTDNWKGGWTWVGERGPELLNLPGGSKVVSNQNSRNMIGHMAEGNYTGPWAPGSTGSQTGFGSNFFGTQPRQLGPIYDQPLGPIFGRMLVPLTNIATNTDATHKAIVSDTARAVRAAATAPHPSIWKTMPALLMPKTDGKQTYADMQKEGIAFAKSFKGTLDEFKSFLQKVPGLFGASSVTSEDMAAAKNGTYQPKADEKLRQLKDLAEHGVKYAGLNVQDFKDALGRIGVKASDDLKTLTAQVTAAWNDQSLFADKKNISSLLDIKAIKASITQQKLQADQSAAGNANLMALFGITPEATKATGKKARQDLQAGLMDASIVGSGAAGTGAAGGGGNIVSSLLGNATVTPESVVPFAQSFMAALGKALTPQKDKNGKSTGVDFGALFATAINDSLATTTALDATGAAILAKITGSFKTVSGVDFIGGIVGAMNTNLADNSAIKALNNVGQKIGYILKQGIADFFKSVDLASAVANGAKPAATTTSTSPLPGNASGTSFWRGGVTRMDERGGEIVDLPRGSRVYPHDVSQQMAMAGAGGPQIYMPVTVTNPIDIEKIAYRVMQTLQKRGRG